MTEDTHICGTTFMRDVQALRDRARQHIALGMAMPAYRADKQVAIALLNTALATELLCVLRYRQHSLVASGITAEAIAAEFLVHSNEELAHADLLAQRIVELGGKPEMDPATLSTRSQVEYVEIDQLHAMIRENLVAERIAIESYREMIEFFGDHDSTTRMMLENILATEEEHANELVDLLTM